MGSGAQATSGNSKSFSHKRNAKRLIAAAAAGVSLLASTHYARADNWFDVNGTSTTPTAYGVVAGTTYSWDDANWATASGGAAATGNWVQGSFARFLGNTGSGTAAGAAYTVTVNGDEQNIGIFNALAGQALTINAAGTGTLDVVGATQQGFLGNTGTITIINAPISGTNGGISPSNGGDIYLRGVNTYALGTTLSSSSTLVHFNSGSSFGLSTGAMNVTLNSATGFVPLLGEGGASITVANPWTITDGSSHNTGINFSADINTPVNLTGDWTVPAALTGFRIRNNGAASSPLTIAGIISGSTAGVTFSGANSGTIVLSGANTYTGTTLIGVSGAATTTLKLGASGVIPDTSVVSMVAGDFFNLGGFDETIKTLDGAGTAAVGTNTLTLANPAGNTFSGVISASAGGKVVKNGSGILLLTGTSTGFNGEFDQTNGTLGIGGPNVFGNGSNTSSVVITGGILSNNATTGRTIPAPISLALNADFTVDDSLFSSSTPGQILFNGPITINNSDRTITVNGTANLGLGGAVGQDASRGIIKKGAGTLALLNSGNTYTGDTTISAGTLSVDADGNIGTSAGTLRLAGAGAIFNTSANRTSASGNAIPNAIVVSANSSITDTGTTGASVNNLNFSTNSFSATNGAVLTFKNTGAATSTFLPRLSGTFSYGGDIIINSPTVTATTTLNSYNTAAVGDQTFSGTISGTGGYERNASSAGTGGLTVFSATNNSYSGPTIINDGVLRADEGAGLPTASALTMTGGTWESSINIVRALGTAADQVQLPSSNSGFGAFGANPITVNLGGLGDGITWGSATFAPASLQLNAVTSNNAIDFQNPLDFGGTSRTVFVGANVATLSGVLSDALANLAGLSKNGTGTLVLANAGNTYDGTTTINAGTVQVSDTGDLGSTTNGIAFNGGTLQLANGPFASASRNITVNGGGGTLNDGGFDSTFGNVDSGTGTPTLTKTGAGTATVNYLRTTGVVINGGAIQIAPNGTSVGTSVVTTITAATGKLNLNDNKLVVKTGNIGAWNTGGSGVYDAGSVNGLVASGLNSGAWTGPGIVTTQSNAQTAQGHLTTLAVARAADVKDFSASSTALFGGQTVVAADVLVMYTWNGDANLDGKVNADDYFQIDSHYNQNNVDAVKSFHNGDFNYDGQINGDDYALIDAAFAGQGNFVFPPAPPLGGVSAVPEPASLGAIGLAALMLGRRRRRAK